MGKFVPVNLRCEYEKNPLGVQRRQPLMSWQVRTEDSQGGFQKAYQIIAASSEKNLEEGIYDIWNTGKVESGLCHGIVYQGAQLSSAKRVYWTVRVWNQMGEVSEYGEPVWFEMGLLEPEDWKGNWMSFLGGMIGNGIVMRYYFRGKGKKIAKARAYVACAGYYEFHLNGNRIGNKILDPAPTDYSKTVLYSVYDVSDLVRSDENVVGFVLGTGWAGLPKVLLQLNIEYEDGSVQEECTDWGNDWSVCRGPIVYNSIYDGEDYDARLEKDGWDTPEYQPVFLKEFQRTGGWILATVVEDPGGEKTSELLPPIRVIERSEPTLLKILEDGRLLYDVGRNQSGWVKISVSGEKGAKVSLSFAEILKESGDLDKTALRLARCEDSYILRGDKKLEEYTPHFTYHGFRFFTVKLEGKIKIEKLTAEFLHSDVEKNAEFRSDNELFNQIAEAMKHTDACNLMGIPTDCAQRDERHGWTTDTTSRAEGCMYHFDMASFFEKWAKDVYDTRNEEGYFADTAPFRWGRRPCDPQVNTPISLVLLMYHTYGDKRIIQENYDSMMRYLHLLLKEADHYLISRTGFGEWACPREECYQEEYGAGAVSKNVTATLVSTGYLYYSISQVKEMAEILGKKDVAYLTGLMETVCTKFNERFFNKETGQYDLGSQSANVLAIDLGLAQRENDEAIIKNLVSDIKKREYHLTTGNMGTKALFEVLCRFGEDDIAYEIMANRTSPGFGYMIENGSTTIWERWEADRDNNIMNSRNQPMFAAACVYFYKHLGGIQLLRTETGVQHLRIAPSVPEKLGWVQVEMDIMNGHVAAEWKKENGIFTLNLTVPFNTRSEVHIPKKCGCVTAITCNGEKMELEELKGTNRSHVYEVTEGKYCFQAKKD